MADIDAPGSPLWWLARLDAQLRKRQKDLRRLDDYAEGRHRLAFATGKYQKEFGDILRGFSDNWCPKVIGAPAERLIIDGFRFPEQPSRRKRSEPVVAEEGDATQGDRDANYLMQANGMDADSSLAMTETLTLGRCFGLVDPTVELGDRKAPGMTIEHPSQFIIAADAGNRRVRRAALKRWRSEWGDELATVYLPGSIHRLQRDRGGWVARQGEDGDGSYGNPMGVVPAVEFANRKRLLTQDGVGRWSDLPKAQHEPILPLQDALNKLVLDLLVASEFGAFVQRWFTGIGFDEDENGNLIPPAWLAGVDRVFGASEPEAKFGQFQATQLANFVTAIEMLVQHVAALTSTPPHYLLAKMANLSGDALAAAETGLVSMVRQMMVMLGEPWEEFVRLGFRAWGDTKRADAFEAETIWRDPEHRTETERTNAAIMRIQAGVPLQQVWEDMGYTSQQRARFHDLLLEEAQARIAAGIKLGVVTPMPTKPATDESEQQAA